MDSLVNNVGGTVFTGSSRQLVFTPTPKRDSPNSQPAYLSRKEDKVDETRQC